MSSVNINFKDDILAEIKTLEEEISTRSKFLNNVVITVSWGAMIALLGFNFKDILNLDNSIKGMFFSSFFCFSMSLYFVILENSFYKDYFLRILVFKKYTLMYSVYKTNNLKDEMNKSFKAIDTKRSKFFRISSTTVKSMAFYFGLGSLVVAVYSVLFQGNN